MAVNKGSEGTGKVLAREGRKQGKERQGEGRTSTTHHGEYVLRSCWRREGMRVQERGEKKEEIVGEGKRLWW